MKTIECSGHIDRGRLEIYNEEVFKQTIREIGFVTHFHMVIEYGNKRTNDQNAYLFGAIVEPIRLRLQQDGWNFSRYQCYKWLENRFSKTEITNDKTGEVITTVMPLKELSTEQWDEIVMQDIRNWAQMDLGIYCKLPHEYYEMTMDAYDRWKRGDITKKQAIELTKKTKICTN